MMNESGKILSFGYAKDVCGSRSRAFSRIKATVKGGILPDIYTEHKWEDYKNGIDVELEKAFSY